MFSHDRLRLRFPQVGLATAIRGENPAVGGALLVPLQSCRKNANMVTRMLPSLFVSQDTMLGPVTRRPGYISCSAASGMEAWHMMNNPNAGGYDAWGASAPPASPTPASRPAGPSSAQTEGRTLGGETGRALTREEVMARRTAALASRTTPAGPASAPSSRNTRTQEEHEVLTGPFEAQLMHLTSMGFTRHESAAVSTVCVRHTSCRSTGPHLLPTLF
mmetsp:Transcript_22381/g.69161  ORF Transcript_22381/g.69161 Transcript_22381/m.69161 type:complete len:218 (-) Transcript_22381:193-846(-)